MSARVCVALSVTYVGRERRHERFVALHNCDLLFLCCVASAAAATGLPACAARAASLIPSSFALAAPLPRAVCLEALASACAAGVELLLLLLLVDCCLPPESAFLAPLLPALGIVQDLTEGFELK